MLYKIIHSCASVRFPSFTISHRLEEVFALLSDRITVLRDGSLVGVVEHDDIVPDKVVRMMIGKELSDAPPHRASCAFQQPHGT